MKMPKRTTAIAAVVVMLFALTGCGEEARSDGNTERAADKQTTEASPQPLTAEVADPDPSEADERFLTYVEAERPVATSIANATDEQLIAAGHEACEQIAAGVAYGDLRLVEGEQPSPAGDYLDTSAIFNGALYNYCPELIEVVD